LISVMAAFAFSAQAQEQQHKPPPQGQAKPGGPAVRQGQPGQGQAMRGPQGPQGQAMRGPQGPQGPHGPQGMQGPSGPAGEPGLGLDLSRAPQDGKKRALYVDSEGRLCYRAGDEHFVVTLSPL